jgi:hypothetical protein
MVEATDMTARLDIVGDVHGQLDALRGLGRHLGYAVDDGWAHPEGRILVFVGDLIDRGTKSLETATLVMNLVQDGRALCLMGNHEYNLVGHTLGVEKPKASNFKTIEDVQRRPREWAPVLEFFRDLPLALDLPELRVIHAVWHLECFERVSGVLGRPVGPSEGHGIEWLRAHTVLRSPFTPHGLVEGLPSEGVPPADDAAHEVLIKGYEEKADMPFTDNDGKVRDLIRATWWLEPGPHIPQDKVTVFGHYWNLPPVAGRHEEHFAPPYPSGHASLRSWQSELVSHVSDRGTASVPQGKKFISVDYNGVATVSAGACVGAYRWPEHHVAWVRTR